MATGDNLEYSVHQFERSKITKDPLGLGASSSPCQNALNDDAIAAAGETATPAAAAPTSPAIPSYWSS